MVVQTKCKNCPSFRGKATGYCDMRCSKKGKEPILLNWDEYNGQEKIATAIENNTGVAISRANISIYSREIEQCLKQEKNDSG